MGSSIAISAAEAERINLEHTNARAPHIERLDACLQDPVEILALFMRYAPGKRMLDVGCGWGRYAHRFIDLGFTYNGVDISEPMLGKARARHPGLAFAAMSQRKLDFPDGSFDAVWNCCSLHYEPKRMASRIVAEFRRVLVKGGIMAIVIPTDGTSYEETSENEAGLFYESGWTMPEFTKKLQQAGLTILERVMQEEQGAMSFIVQT